VVDTVITDITENVPVSTDYGTITDDTEIVRVSTLSNIDDLLNNRIDSKINNLYTIDDVDKNNNDNDDYIDNNGKNINILNENIEATRLEYIEKISKISENIDTKDKNHEKINENINENDNSDIDKRLDMIENIIINENEKTLKKEKDHKLKIKKNMRLEAKNPVPQGDFGILPPVPPLMYRGVHLNEKGEK
jgi:hypothetical protein